MRILILILAIATLAGCSDSSIPTVAPNVTAQQQASAAKSMGLTFPPETRFFLYHRASEEGGLPAPDDAVHLKIELTASAIGGFLSQSPLSAAKWTSSHTLTDMPKWPQSLTCAEPAPEQPKKPAVELKLSANSLNSLEITIQNNGQEPLVLPYRVSPFEHFVVDMRGEKGKQYKFQHTGEKLDKVAKAEPGSLTVPAGESKTLSLHTCHFLHTLGEGEQKVTFSARLKHNGLTIESQPLTVDP